MTVTNMGFRCSKSCDSFVSVKALIACKMKAAGKNNDITVNFR